MIASSVPAVAAPKEPLVVTQMADPDPNFVPAAQDGQHAKSVASADSEDAVQIDQAMESLGRAIGEAAAIAHRQMEARCRELSQEHETAEQRFARAATCRYNRY